MANDQRRDRATEAAAAINATNNAALSVTAGNLILGALLAPVAEHRDQESQVRAVILPGEETPHAVSSENIPPTANVSTSASAQAAALSHGSDMAAWQPPGHIEPISAAPENGTAGNPLARLLSELQGDADVVRAGHGSSPTGGTASFYDLPSADPHVVSAATLSEPTNIVDRLVADLGHGLEPLLNSLLDMSAVWQQTTSTIDQSVTQLITTIEGLSAAAVLQDLGDTLHTAADRIVQNLDLPVLELPTLGSEPSMLGLFDDTHSSTIDAAAIAGTGTALLDDLPASLLGGPQANPQADGVLADAFGTSVPQSETVTAATIAGAPAEGTHTQTNAFSAFDVGSMLVGDTGQVTLGFIGQSYIDAFDAHDVSHHASHSLHGLV